jgi:hypothetical protein
MQSGPPVANSPIGYLLRPKGTPGLDFNAASGFPQNLLNKINGLEFLDAGDLDSLYTPRSRTPTSSYIFFSMLTSSSMFI